MNSISCPLLPRTWELARRVATLESQFTALDIVDVAAATDRSIDDVVGVYTTVGDRLRLDWLRDRVVSDLQRDDRWHALARNALRDDAYGEHRAITAAVVRAGRPGEPPDSAFDRWVEHRGPAVARAVKIPSRPAS